MRGEKPEPLETGVPLTLYLSSPELSEKRYIAYERLPYMAYNAAAASSVISLYCLSSLSQDTYDYKKVVNTSLVLKNNNTEDTLVDKLHKFIEYNKNKLIRNGLHEAGFIAKIDYIGDVKVISQIGNTGMKKQLANIIGSNKPNEMDISYYQLYGIQPKLGM